MIWDKIINGKSILIIKRLIYEQEFLIYEGIPRVENMLADIQIASLRSQ